MFSIALVFAFVSVAVSNPLNYGRGECTISLDFQDKDLGEQQPLILRNEKNLEILYPKTNERVLKVPSGKSIYLECPGKGNYLNITEGNVTAARAVCVRNKTFIVNDVPHNFTSVSCKFLPRHDAKRVGSCLENGTLMKIGYELKNGFLPTIEICRDDTTYRTYYTKVHITKRIATYQSGYPRPAWVAGKFFGNVKVQNQYRMEEQVVTLAKILKSEKLADKYVKPSIRYMSRGHLTAKVDFVYGSLQATTFWYLNAQPQWQSFNAGNWNDLEMNVRSYATNHDLDLIVYTGVHGQMTLKDVDGRSQPIHLYVNGTEKALPVPKFYWKVVYEPLSKNGTAFVGVNNPYIKRITRSLYLCKDISDKIDWLTWSPKDIEAGISYACEVDDLRKSIPTVPVLDVKGLLL